LMPIPIARVVDVERKPAHDQIRHLLDSPLQLVELSRVGRWVVNWLALASRADIQRLPAIQRANRGAFLAVVRASLPAGLGSAQLPPLVRPPARKPAPPPGSLFWVLPSLLRPFALLPSSVMASAAVSTVKPNCVFRIVLQPAERARPAVRFRRA